MKKTNKPKRINVRLLRRIQKIILAEPRKFDIAYWHHGDDGEISGRNFERCNTAHCIGGWAQVLTKQKGWGMNAGGRALGLDLKQRRRLFLIQNWPERFQYELNGWNSRTKANAKLAAARIEHFIKTNGAE